MFPVPAPITSTEERILVVILVILLLNLLGLSTASFDSVSKIGEFVFPETFRSKFAKLASGTVFTETDLERGAYLPDRFKLVSALPILYSSDSLSLFLP